MIVSVETHHINFNYYIGINLVMASSDPIQKSNIPNPFLNPIGCWQHYLLTWIEVSKESYETFEATRANNIGGDLLGINRIVFNLAYGSK